jgi:hypothetical protein
VLTELAKSRDHMVAYGVATGSIVKVTEGNASGNRSKSNGR